MDALIPTTEHRQGPSTENMSSASQPRTSQLLGAGSAANADKLADGAPVASTGLESTGGWDAYDVWRRFIKEARERRKLSREAN